MRLRPRATPLVALALAIAGIFGATQVTEGDLLRLGRALWRVIAPAPERAPPRARAPAEADGKPFSGHPRIVDGDTLDLNGIRVRMQGIDALEHDQSCNRRGGGSFACGTAAREKLAALAAAGTVTCTPDGTMTYGRTVAVCTVQPPGGAALDLNGAMVRSGLAFDCPRFSGGRYAAEEAAARAAGEGAWAGRFTFPWSHRDRAGACDR
jgi:endonuclease YncB( thermonuclease family)